MSPSLCISKKLHNCMLVEISVLKCRDGLIQRMLILGQYSPPPPTKGKGAEQ